jgi:type 1 glutamine amidotransferase
MATQTMLIVTQVAPYGTGTPSGPGPAGVHGVLPQAAVALSQLATMAGLKPKVVQDVTELGDDELASTRLLCLFTIGETPYSQSQRQVIEVAWSAGRLGVLGIHAATDAAYGWPGHQRLLGGRFDGHPWTASFEIDVADRGHPATAALPARWPWRDEVYLFRELRPDLRILLRLDPAQLDMSAPAARVPEWGVPLAWCHEEGAGRSFYSSLGHFPEAWERPDHLRYLAGALNWLLVGT